MRTGLLASAAWCLAAASTLPAAPALDVAEEGSRAATVHRIPLYDDLGAELGPDSDQPFSMKATCGQCHDYETISGGWHFNSADPDVPPGRPAQPWVLVDRATGTWLPISSRPWDHAYRPQDVGLSPWAFIQAFGRHYPGGGLGEKHPAETMDPQARWLVSGDLDVNCMACHSGRLDQDQSEWATQIARQNLRWAGAAATGLCLVDGSVASLPDTFDPLDPDAALDDPKAIPPSAAYDKPRFDPKENVFFDIPKVPATNRCYYCHTNRPVGEGVPKLWAVDEDVHLAAGMTCADCHRHGLDHRIRRGYEGEPLPEGRPDLETLSCRGCHLGDESAAAGPHTFGGRLGAPVPVHKGLPTHHLEKLSCTACHSGPWPESRAGRVQTGRIHGLGIRGRHHPDDQPPIVAEPVFIVEPWSGKTAPQRMVWPAFWGIEAEGGDVTPLLPEVVTLRAGDAIEQARREAGTKGSALTEAEIAAGLAALAESGGAGTPVYVSGGRLYRLSAEGGLATEDDHEAAHPYSWPIAHDVRPAARSLGVSSNCSDCHAAESPLFFGEVVAAGPAEVGEPRVLRMYELQGRDRTELEAWALSYKGRPLFKIVGYAAAGLIAAVVILYLFRALSALTRWLARTAPGARTKDEAP